MTTRLIHVHKPWLLRSGWYCSTRILVGVFNNNGLQYQERLDRLQRVAACATLIKAGINRISVRGWSRVRHHMNCGRQFSYVFGGFQGIQDGCYCLEKGRTCNWMFNRNTWDVNSYINSGNRRGEVCRTDGPAWAPPCARGLTCKNNVCVMGKYCKGIGHSGDIWQRDCQAGFAGGHDYFFCNNGKVNASSSTCERVATDAYCYSYFKLGRFPNAELCASRAAKARECEGYVAYNSSQTGDCVCATLDAGCERPRRSSDGAVWPLYDVSDPAAMIKGKYCGPVDRFMNVPPTRFQDDMRRVCVESVRQNDRCGSFFAYQSGLCRCLLNGTQCSDIFHITECPVDTYGVAPACIKCPDSTTTEGRSGRLDVGACTDASQSLIIPILGGVSLLLILIYYLTSLPALPRIDVAPRKAFVVGIEKYTGTYKKIPLRRLPGASFDADRMRDALTEANFKVTLHLDVKKAKAIGNKEEKDRGKFVPNPGNIMELFDNWCINWVNGGDDIFIYFACHGLKYEGSQWIVASQASLEIPLAVAMQCVENNWIRIRVAVEKPRVSIFAFDQCDVPVQFTDGKTSSGIHWRDVVKKHMVDISQLNSSRAALNVVIFRGAADMTQAKEDIETGGDFTSAFLKYMHKPNRTLAELSTLIRSELGRKAAPVKTSREMIEDIGARTDEDVQVSPTENYLEFEYHGWTFFESPTSCCGFVPRETENHVIRCVLKTKTCYSNDESEIGRGRGTVSRSFGGEDDLDFSKETVQDMMYFDKDKSSSGDTFDSEMAGHRQTHSSVWQALSNDQGRTYYYNRETDTSVWERPDELDASHSIQLVEQTPDAHTYRPSGETTDTVEFDDSDSDGSLSSVGTLASSEESGRRI